MISIFVGSVSVWNGAVIYRALFIVVASALAASIADYEILAWGIAAEQFSEMMIAVQVGVVVAVATHHGFEGAQVLLGATVGIVGAHGSSSWVRGADHTVHGLLLFWYSSGALFGVLVFTLWRPMILKTLAPLAGGFLVSTGIGFAASRCCASLAGASRVPPILPPPNIDWVTSAAGLLAPAGHGNLVGACSVSLLALVFQAFGGQKKKLLAVSSLLAYILAMCAAALLSKKFPGSWQWPLCGGLLWAAITALSASYQLDSVEDAELRDCLSGKGSGNWRQSDYFPGSQLDYFENNRRDLSLGGSGVFGNGPAEFQPSAPLRQDRSVLPRGHRR